MNKVDKLNQTVNQFCGFIESLPAQALLNRDWGPREVLAHLVYHHELYVRLAKASVDHRQVAPITGRFRDVNAAAVAENRGASAAQLVSRLREANRHLVELYQQHCPDKIVIEIKKGARLRTLQELVPRVEAHIRNHLRALVREHRDRNGDHRLAGGAMSEQGVNRLSQGLDQD